MGRPPKSNSPTGTTGLILSVEEANRLRADPRMARSANFGWGHSNFEWYPFQRDALTSLVDEIALLGGVGGGKSQVMRGWLISGNPHLPINNPDGSPNFVNRSYMYHPGYAALILRKNEKDMWQFIRKADEMYKPMGISYVNGQFEYPGGGSIVVGHMADQTSWTKYLGNEYVRIAIDEAPLIPEFYLYEELMVRLRTVYSELRTQIMIAGNYGGPGSGWIFDRFMNVPDGKGGVVPPGSIMREEITDPITGKTGHRTRIWIFSTFRDNPKYRDSPNYRLILGSITDPKRRAAYLEGEWNVFSGAYFDVFRKRHKPPEPAHAIHVIPARSIPLHPWFARALGMDVGYSHETAIYWLAQHGTTAQLHVYREMVASQTSYERLGYELARATLDELNAFPSHALSLYLSHDAFAKKTEQHSIVELIALGMARVLGPNAVHIPDLVIKRLLNLRQTGAFLSPAEEKEQDSVISALRTQRLSGITIRMAPKASPMGWQYLRELMRWERITVARPEFDPDVAVRILRDSPHQYEDYLRACSAAPEEVVPKLQIWDACPLLIDAIPRARYKEDTDNVDDKHFLGKDRLDALLYLVTGFRDELTPEPFEQFRDQTVNNYVRENPRATTQDLVWVNRHIEQEWKSKETPISLSIPRNGRRQRLLAQMDPNNPARLM